jgi:hypothetical protein
MDKARNDIKISVVTHKSAMKSSTRESLVLSKTPKTAIDKNSGLFSIGSNTTTRHFAGIR